MKRIFCCLLLLLFAVSCDKKYTSNIPDDFPVYIELDLTFEDKDLYGPSSHKIFTNDNLNPTRVRAVGFGGVIVLHALEGGFYAFDLACPYEGKRDTRLEIDENSIYAICPKCNSRFDISYGIGNAESGPANEAGFRMKSYSVNKAGNNVSIRN